MILSVGHMSLVLRIRGNNFLLSSVLSLNKSSQKRPIVIIHILGYCQSDGYESFVPGALKPLLSAACMTAIILLTVMVEEAQEYVQG